MKVLQEEVRKILMSWKPHVFNDIMHDLVARWQKCSAAGGAYFEDDNVEIDPLFVQEIPEDPGSDDDSD